MKSLSRIGAALAMASSIAGCATPRPSTPAAVVTPQGARVIPPGRPANAVAVGKSTRADVVAALGETQVIRFESGFEVWVYRIASDTPAKAAAPRGAARDGLEKEYTAGEFVVLIAPSGVVARTRIRPPGNGNARLLHPGPDSGRP